FKSRRGRWPTKYFSLTPVSGVTVQCALAIDRFPDLANWLGGREYLEEVHRGRPFMTTVLRILRRHTDLVAQVSVLEAYRLQCEEPTRRAGRSLHVRSLRKPDY